MARVVLERVTIREELTSSRKEGSVVDRIKKWQEMVQFDGMNCKIRSSRVGGTDIDAEMAMRSKGDTHPTSRFSERRTLGEKTECMCL